jgi:hypothetical protein
MLFHDNDKDNTGFFYFERVDEVVHGAPLINNSITNTNFTKLIVELKYYIDYLYKFKTQLKII